MSNDLEIQILPPEATVLAEGRGKLKTDVDSLAPGALHLPSGYLEIVEYYSLVRDPEAADQVTAVAGKQHPRSHALRRQFAGPRRQLIGFRRQLMAALRSRFGMWRAARSGGVRPRERRHRSYGRTQAASAGLSQTLRKAFSASFVAAREVTSPRRPPAATARRAHGRREATSARARPDAPGPLRRAPAWPPRIPGGRRPSRS